MMYPFCLLLEGLYVLHLGLLRKVHDRACVLGHDFPSFQWAKYQLLETGKPVGLLHLHSIFVDADVSTLVDKLRSYARVDVPNWL
jgi:hypothetical protein